MDYVKAFIVGGLICAAAQVLLDRTKMMPGRVMVSLVVAGCILGALGITSPLRNGQEPGHPYLFWGLGIHYGRAFPKESEKTAF